MKWSLSLGRISGIKVFIHWTFLILIGWIIMQNALQGQTVNQIIWAVTFILAIFVCVFLHELGHALAARRYGIHTQDITILPIGGLARLEKLPEDPRQELVVAFAGPAVNLVIAGILFLIVNILPASREDFDLSTINSGTFLYTLFSANLILALFNLIPAFPMDGGRVLRALLSFKFSRVKATRVAASIGQVLAIFFVVVGLFYNPILLLIGFFIFLGAQAEASFIERRSLMYGYHVYDVLMKDYKTLHTDDELSHAVDLLLNGQSKVFLVLDGEKIAGTLSKNEIIKALSEYGKQVKVGEVMNHQVYELDFNMPLEEAYSQFQQERQAIMPVIRQGILEGIVDIDNIHEFIMIKNAVGSEDDYNRKGQTYDREPYKYTS